MNISYGTDVGKIRDENQDTVYVHEFSDTVGLFIVADGMGGYEGGKLASSTAATCISDYVKAEYNTRMSDEQIKEMLQIAIKMASSRIYDMSRDNRRLEGMGTTVVICLIYDNKLYTASVGDSRCYILSKKTLRQITSDHSLVNDLLKRGLITKAEAKVHPQKNVITRAVGSEKTVEADTFVNELNTNDIVLMCSDGLHSMVAETKIKDVLLKEHDKQAEKLICLANDNGGKDNISVITVKISDEVKI